LVNHIERIANKTYSSALLLPFLARVARGNLTKKRVMGPNTYHMLCT
jgi:hypothetical protein